MAWVPNRAAQARCVPFAAFMLLLVLRGLVPGDGSWGFDPRWILAITVLVVGALLAWYWREYGELAVSYTHLRCRRSTLCRSRWSPYH